MAAVNDSRAKIKISAEPSVTVHTCFKTREKAVMDVFHRTASTPNSPVKFFSGEHEREADETGPLSPLREGRSADVAAHISTKRPARMRQSRKHFHLPKRSLRECQISHFLRLTASRRASAPLLLGTPALGARAKKRSGKKTYSNSEEVQGSFIKCGDLPNTQTEKIGPCR